jgi:hypothetical protein
MHHDEYTGYTTAALRASCGKPSPVSKLAGPPAGRAAAATWRAGMCCHQPVRRGFLAHALPPSIHRPAAQAQGQVGRGCINGMGKTRSCRSSDCSRSGAEFGKPCSAVPAEAAAQHQFHSAHARRSWGWGRAAASEAVRGDAPSAPARRRRERRSGKGLGHNGDARGQNQDGDEGRQLFGGILRPTPIKRSPAPARPAQRWLYLLRLRHLSLRST